MLQRAATITCQLSGRIHSLNIGSPFLMCFIFAIQHIGRMSRFYLQYHLSKNQIKRHFFGKCRYQHNHSLIFLLITFKTRSATWSHVMLFLAYLCPASPIPPNMAQYVFYYVLPSEFVKHKFSPSQSHLMGAIRIR